jgi:hypothetical protein
MSSDYPHFAGKEEGNSEGIELYIVTFTKFLQYTIVEFTPSIILMYPPPPIPGIVSTGLMSTYFHHTLLHPFLLFPPVEPI